MAHKWLYVNFEWLDWIWKTTQFNKLTQEINAIPLSSHINKEIKSIRAYIEELSKDNIDLRLSYFLMASIHDSEKANSLLSEWKNIVSDRNIFSTLAYHRALWSNFAKSIDLTTLNILLPDLTIYLDANEKERNLRMKNRKILSTTDKHLEENEALLKQVRLEYSKFYEYMVRIDTTNKNIDSVFNEVMKQVQLKIKNLII